AMLDLTGKSVSGPTIHSDNTAGTTFTVDSKPTAFQVFGGDGADTLNAPTLAFTALEREAIFATTSIESIVDTSGTYNFTPDPNTFTLTTGSDMLAASAANAQVRGNALTFNAGDDLDGGDGFDSLVLFGGGTFDLNSLANFAGFEE